MKCLFAFVFQLIFFAMALGQDLSGQWFVNANGHRFILEINQDEGEIDGTMKDVCVNGHSVLVSTITGKIQNWQVSFDRDNEKLAVPQKFEGYLFLHEDQEGLKYRKMAGVFEYNGAKYGWYAVKE